MNVQTTVHFCCCCVDDDDDEFDISHLLYLFKSFSDFSRSELIERQHACVRCVPSHTNRNRNIVFISTISSIFVFFFVPYFVIMSMFSIDKCVFIQNVAVFHLGRVSVLTKRNRKGNEINRNCCDCHCWMLYWVCWDHAFKVIETGHLYKSLF